MWELPILPVVHGGFVVIVLSLLRIPRGQLAEAARVNQTVRRYLVELDQQNPTEEPGHQQDRVSTTDPDSTYASQGRHAGSAGVFRQLLGGEPQLRDRGSARHRSRRMSQDVAAQDMRLTLNIPVDQSHT